MKKTLKRGLCLVLAMVLALAMGITALAAGITTLAECEHESHHSTYRRVSGYRYVSNTQCSAEYEETWNCKKCGQKLVKGTVTLKSDHVGGSVYSSSCNGSMQTWWRNCSNCNHGFSELHRCPKAPHSGSCTVLPCAVPPETVKK